MPGHPLDYASINQAARTLLAAGFSVIPTGANKRPALPSWKPYQDRLMTEDEVNRHFATVDRLAAIGGRVSGNLECLDFDDPSIYAPFLDLLTKRDPSLAASLVKRKTPSGGFHLISDNLNSGLFSTGGHGWQ